MLLICADDLGRHACFCSVEQGILAKGVCADGHGVGHILACLGVDGWMFNTWMECCVMVYTLTKMWATTQPSTPYLFGRHAKASNDTGGVDFVAYKLIGTLEDLCSDDDHRCCTIPNLLVLQLCQFHQDLCV